MKEWRELQETEVSAEPEVHDSQPIRGLRSRRTLPIGVHFREDAAVVLRDAHPLQRLEELPLGEEAVLLSHHEQHREFAVFERLISAPKDAFVERENGQKRHSEELVTCCVPDESLANAEQTHDVIGE
jgi:hypothetical protein